MTTATATPPVAAAPGSRRHIAVFAVLAAGLVALVLASVGRGQVEIPAAEVLGSIFHRLGLDWGTLPTHPQGDAVLWQVRFPRVAMSAVVGVTLAVAGAVMQGVFGNPLAEPGVVGVSSGAALAAATAIGFGWATFGSFLVPVFAFAGAIITTFVVYIMSRDGGRTEIVTLVLVGIAVNAIANAGMAFVMFTAPSSAREEIVFWTLGSMNGTRWPYVGWILPLAVGGMIGSVAIARRLDILSLGDRSARHVGVDVERLRLLAIVLVAFLTAAAVSYCGVIGFVGLVVPHLIRLLLGPGHRALIPASALGGAVLLVAVDLFARTAVQYADLPIGMLTALIGGPFFFWLLRRTRATSGGWA